jgi:adenosylcobinamide-GDP ribazoletransferase
VSGPLVALEFLTTLRLRRVPQSDPVSLARSLPWFSLIGLLIGLLIAALDTVLWRVLPEPALAALLITVLVIVTGGLHLDGLADTCDGLGGGATVERRLEIMRDSRTGSFGVIGVVLVLLLKWSALMSLQGDARLAALIAVPALSRMALAAAIVVYPYARPEGLGKHFHAQANVWSVAINVVVPALALFLLQGIAGVLLIVAAFAFVLLGGAYIKSRIGGLTGDSYGALVETGEAVLLLVAVASAKIGWLG